jgi:hypothetical protein
LAVDRDPTEMADKLFDIAEGDLVPEGGTGVNLVHVCREADSFAAALLKAVEDVELTGLVVTGIASDDLVSLRDIAARLGRTYESVRLSAAGKRGPDFPRACNARLSPSALSARARSALAISMACPVRACAASRAAIGSDRFRVAAISASRALMAKGF